MDAGADGTVIIVITLLAIAVPQALVREYLIVSVPEVMAVTTPVDASTVAIDVLELLHVPPDTESDIVAEIPEQIDAKPVIDETAGSGLTVTG